MNSESGFLLQFDGCFNKKDVKMIYYNSSVQVETFLLRIHETGGHQIYSEEFWVLVK